MIGRGYYKAFSKDTPEDEIREKTAEWAGCERKEVEILDYGSVFCAHKKREGEDDDRLDVRIDADDDSRPS